MGLNLQANAEDQVARCPAGQRRSNQMIIYSKHLWGFPLLCRSYGSTLPRAFPFAVFSSVLTWIIEEYAGDETRLWFDHPYPYQMYAWVVGFVLIFRSNFGYQRYWEGRTRIQDMSSKWIDGAAMVLCFDEATSNEKAIQGLDGGESGVEFRNKFIHFMSMMHALALQQLRADNGELALKTDDTGGEPTQAGNLYCLGSQEIYSRESRMEAVSTYNQMFSHEHALSQTLSENKPWFTGSPAGPGKKEMNALPDLEAPLGEALSHDSSVRSAQPDHVLGSPRHNLSTNRLFTAESDKWGFKEKLGSCCMLRPDVDRRNRYNESKPLAVIGEITPAEIKALNGTCERAHMAFGWVLRAIGRRSQQGGINASPPVFSRVYQVLSDGMTGYNNAVKLHDTPFPFPYSQFIFFNLILFSLTVPWIVSAKIGDKAGETADWGSKVVCCVVTFMIVLVYFALNEVARDLEDPFNHDPNELPLMVMQRNFNQRIAALMAKEAYDVEAGPLDIQTGLLHGRQPEAVLERIATLAEGFGEAVRERGATLAASAATGAAGEGQMPSLDELGVIPEEEPDKKQL